MQCYAVRIAQKLSIYKLHFQTKISAPFVPCIITHYIVHFGCVQRRWDACAKTD